MTQTTKDLLIGKWQFIGAESYTDSAWQPSPNYVDSMTWEFFPQYFSPNQTLGNIVESSNKETEKPATISYAFNHTTGLLTLEIYTDQTSGSYADPQVDKYHVTFDEQANNTIKISILNECECPPPYFRYTLQQIESDSI